MKLTMGVVFKNLLTNGLYDIKKKINTLNDEDAEKIQNSRIYVQQLYHLKFEGIPRDSRYSFRAFSFSSSFVAVLYVV